MTGTQVFDRLAMENDASADRASDADALARLAEQMVAASIASGKMLRELRERMFPAVEDPGALAVARALRADFQQWVTDAEAVVERARGDETGSEAKSCPGAGGAVGWATKRGQKPKVVPGRAAR